MGIVKGDTRSLDYSSAVVNSDEQRILQNTNPAARYAAEPDRGELLCKSQIRCRHAHRALQAQQFRF